MAVSPLWIWLFVRVGFGGVVYSSTRGKSTNISTRPYVSGERVKMKIMLIISIILYLFVISDIIMAQDAFEGCEKGMSKLI